MGAMLRFAKNVMNCTKTYTKNVIECIKIYTKNVKIEAINIAKNVINPLNTWLFEAILVLRYNGC